MEKYVIVRLSDMQVVATAIDAAFAREVYDALLAAGKENRYKYDCGELTEMKEKHPELIPFNARNAGRKAKCWTKEEAQQLQETVREQGIGAAAKEYGVTPKTIYKWLRMGKD